jgi:hypothetical protein
MRRNEQRRRRKETNNTRPDQVRGVGRSGVRWTSDKVPRGGAERDSSRGFRLLRGPVLVGIGFVLPDRQGPQDWGLLGLDYSKAGWGSAKDQEPSR